MGKYFGTDGIRGKFNSRLTIDLTLKIAMAAAKVFKEEEENPVVCIAKDPRISSNAIEQALAAGLTAGGVDVEVFGVVTTPVVSHMIITEKKYIAGIMVSASHNPYYDNGIKFFGKDGKKLNDELSDRIEAAIDENSYDFNSEVGSCTYVETAKTSYIDYLVANGTDLTGLNIGIDGANGASFEIAPAVFKKLGANVHEMAIEPNGVNINNGVGSTHPEKLAELVKEKGLDFGFAFDGDGDRIMLIDQDGEVLDGDYIIYLITKKLKNEGKLNKNVAVGTVMANLGFKAALEKLEVEFSETAVGDKYVMQRIDELDASVGGEQSGHIILPDLLPTGDGILTAVYLAKVFAEDKEQLPTLKTEMAKFPQELINIPVNDKDAVLTNKELWALIEEKEAELGTDGRILVRASGTEELIRVMVEAKTTEVCHEVAGPIVDKVKNI